MVGRSYSRQRVPWRNNRVHRRHARAAFAAGAPGHERQRQRRRESADDSRGIGRKDREARIWWLELRRGVMPRVTASRSNLGTNAKRNGRGRGNFGILLIIRRSSTAKRVVVSPVFR